MARCCLPSLFLILAFGVLETRQREWKEIDLKGHDCGMSSTYPKVGISSECHGAINGNTSRYFQTTPGHQNCIHTAVNDATPCWWVDLGHVYTIYYIRIYARDGQFQRLTYLRVAVDGQVVFDSEGIQPTIVYKDGDHNSDPFFDITGDGPGTSNMPVTGRNLTIIRYDTVPPDRIIINICEVQVWECADGYYGKTCDACNRGCMRRICNKQDGQCTEGCEDGYHSLQCQTPCNNNCGGPNHPCDRDTAECSQGCVNGYHGQQCQTPCSNNCRGQNRPCDQDTGGCTHGCTQGHYGTTCDNDCGDGCSGNICERNTGNCNCSNIGWQSPKCTVCDDQHYGDDCTKVCGHCSRGAACDKQTGGCPGCDPGWIPPKCTNECHDGYYGADCRQHCWNCADDTPCDKVDGHCAACKPGYLLPLCKTACPPGTYGSNCTKPCGNCLNKEVCNRTTGHCTACVPGYSLPLCEECDGGFYGDNCSLPCGHCADGQLCDKTDGHCQTCAPGYVPQVCHQACRQGFYGQDCKEECGNCTQGTVCDHVTGLCIGCVEGFDGALCKACRPGLWGWTNCSLPCGNCAGDGSCDKMSGNCTHGCRDGWTSGTCLQKAAENNGNNSNLVGAIVGAVVGTGVFVGVAILLAAVLVIRSRRSNGTTKPDEPEFQRSAKTSQETAFDGTEVGGASNLNTEDPYDELENYENTRDERAPYTRLEPGASATPSQDTQYEKLAAQYHNTEDVKPYEALSLPSGKKGKQAVQSNPTANRHSSEYVNSSGNTGKHVYSNTSFPHRK